MLAAVALASKALAGSTYRRRGRSQFASARGEIIPSPQALLPADVMRAVFEFLFGCQHRRTTFPLTSAQRSSGRGSTYIVCLGCGREFRYNWQEMRIDTPAVSLLATMVKRAESLLPSRRCDAPE